MRKFAIIFFITAFCSAGTAQADKLLTKNGAVYAPHQAVTVTTSTTALTMDVAAEYDAQQLADQLKEKLPGITINCPVGTNKIELSGQDLPALQAQLAAVDIDLTLAVDPLAALGNLGTDTALVMEGPEVGGSIRASNPLVISPDFVTPASDFKETQVEDRFTARIISVEQGVFPEVTLSIRVRQVNGRGARVVNNEAYRAVVLFPGYEGRPDLSTKFAQTNLAAYYLQPNDKIEAHLLRKSNGVIYLDFVQRIP